MKQKVIVNTCFCRACKYARINIFYFFCKRENRYVQRPAYTAPTWCPHAEDEKEGDDEDSETGD